MKQQLCVLNLDSEEQKPYFGTMDDIASFTKAEGQDKIKVIGFVPCHKGVVQILTDRYWLYRTAQGVIYDLHADKIELTQVAVKYDGYFHRCMKARFTNLSIETHYSSQEHHPIDVIEGQPCAFISDFEDKDHRIIESRFYVSEDSYNTLKEARERMGEQYISFDSLMDDIFGDN